MDRRRRDPLALYPEAKACLSCGVVKPLWEFHKDASRCDGVTGACRVCGNARVAAYAKAHPEKGRNRQAVYTAKFPERVRDRSRQYHEENRDARRSYSQKRIEDLNSRGLCGKCGKEPRRDGKMYGNTCANYFTTRNGGYELSHEKRQDLWETQGKSCAICKVALKDYWVGVIDHNHDTATVRGMLCQNCNRGLGMFKDSAESLRMAVEYITLTALESRS